MAVKLHTDCAATKLVSTNSGQCQFFTHVMEKLDEQQFGVFVIGKKVEGAGGYFTEKNLVTRIVLPEGTATYDEVNNTISFPSDKNFAIFVHEASHFLHMVVDKGHYMAKPLRGMEDISINSKDFLDMKYRKYIEYEAGWRSLVYNQRYNMDIADVILKVNLTNMSNYLSESEDYQTYIKKPSEDIFNKKMEFFKNTKAKQEDVVKWTEEVFNPAMDKCVEIIKPAREAYLDNVTKFAEIGNMKFNYTIDAAAQTEISTILGAL